MCKVTLLAVDLAKDVFQVAGFTRKQKVVFHKQIRRKNLLEFMVQQSPCEVVMEACYSSHYWAAASRIWVTPSDCCPLSMSPPLCVETKVTVTTLLRLLKRLVERT